MQSSNPVSACLTVSLLALPLLGMGTAGCYSFWGCDASASCPMEGTDEEEGTACPRDPAEGEVRESCGVWVSAALGDDDNPGTQGKPVRTLSRAVELADPAAHGLGRVYACGGAEAESEYRERVMLPAGISLSGGFACAGGWSYAGEVQRAVIHAPPAPAVLALAENGEESWITDVVVVADNAMEPGGSSIAVIALEGSNALLRRAELVAGNGADGLDGEDGSHDQQPAKQGLPGNDGVDACTVDPGLGGATVVTQCDDGSQSIGGQGGDGDALVATAGWQGLPAPEPNPEGYGAGGEGQNAAQATKCVFGAHGAHGQDGDEGSGGTGTGTLTKDGFVGADGEHGLPGFPGQGGGGGGASLGASCGALPKGGAGGGSGGSGGCGGRGGKGGQAGGSSIGVALLSNGIALEDVVIRTGNGGKGGNGGAMQIGGKGGLPGDGGAGLGGPGGAQNGCAGGVGGHGGNGGSGGGGRGGHSATMVRTKENLLKRMEHLAYIRGESGAGGLGGGPSINGGDGYPGDNTDCVTIVP